MSVSPIPSVPAVVLAGGRNKPPMAAAAGSEYRALTPFRGRPMVDHVVRALCEAESVAEITVVGPIPASNGFRVIADHGGFVENIYAGLDAVEAEFVLISTSDIPFVTSESIDAFIAQARAEDADVVYPVVRLEDCYKQFPGIKRTAVRLKEGEFTGGNVALVRKEFMDTQRERIARAYGLRKSPLQLALMIGLGTAIKLAGTIILRRPLLSIPQLESSISRVIGGKSLAAVTGYAELATDIDRDSDLAVAESVRTLPES